MVAFRNYDDGDYVGFIMIMKMKTGEWRSDEFHEDEDICEEVHLVEQLERPIVD